MSMLESSISGLLAAQRALATTSHNISNVNTEGYTRQRVDFSARTPQPYGNGYVGSGVNVDTIRRIYDQSREEAVRSNTSDFHRLDTFASFTGRINNLLADEDAGLAPALQAFSDAIHGVANDPASAAAREVMLAEGQNLVSRVHFLDSRFQELTDDVDRQLEVQVAQINELSSGIAKLNKEIIAAEGRVGQPPNDLLDQRDQLVKELSELVGAKAVVQGDGQYNVFIGNGQPLVTGAEFNKLAIVPGTEDPSSNEIAISTGGSSVNITRNLSGGSVGGLLDFRREVLNPLRSDLDTMVSDFATAFNEQHQQGYYVQDGEAHQGGAFFKVSANARDFGLEITEASEIAAAASNDPEAVGDNSNMLKLAEFMEQGELHDAYTSLVGQVGTQMMRAEINRDAQKVMLNQAVEARESISGVNLEEEAANLVKYQQFYQASAQVVTVADTLFQTLLQAVRR